MKRIAFIGSREYKDLDLVSEYIGGLTERSVIVTGGHYDPDRKMSYPTRGVDAAAFYAALAWGHVPVLVVANWEAHGKAAGHVRNPVIVDLADEVRAFWNGKSSGTKAGIDYARCINKPLVVHGS